MEPRAWLHPGLARQSVRGVYIMTEVAAPPGGAYTAVYSPECPPPESASNES